MSMPVLEESENAVSCEQAINDILESIALEEAGLAHIINAEGEKIQKVISNSKCTDDLIRVNDSVTSTLENLIKMQMLLQFKLEKVAMLCKKRDC